MPARVVFVVAVSTCMLTGCSATEVHRIDELPGYTFDRAAAWIANEPTLLVQDVSVLVGEEPTYEGSQFGSDLWTIVAACADANEVERATSLEIAVLPTASITADIEAAIRHDRYADTVNCDSRPHR